MVQIGPNMLIRRMIYVKRKRVNKNKRNTTVDIVLTLSIVFIFCTGEV